jgi:transposase-like protein
MIQFAISLQNPKFHLLSVDEKTGIQALERKHITQPEPGKDRRIEYEYTRNGTTCLMAAEDLATGEILSHRIHTTRTEEDFLAFIKQTVSTFPQDHTIVFLADQLNTHMSETLVQWVAQQLGYEGDLGKKGSKGILKSMPTRRQFLETETHRIRFIFTPKHCSWLNPIENWFGRLQRRAISHESFSSIEKLTHRIEAYVAYHNRCWAKPIKWKFKGFKTSLKT